MAISSRADGSVRNVKVLFTCLFFTHKNRTETVDAVKHYWQNKTRFVILWCFQGFYCNSYTPTHAANGRENFAVEYQADRPRRVRMPKGPVNITSLTIQNIFYMAPRTRKPACKYCSHLKDIEMARNKGQKMQKLANPHHKTVGQKKMKCPRMTSCAFWI